jgi:hypothetical protein
MMMMVMMAVVVMMMMMNYKELYIQPYLQDQLIPFSFLYLHIIAALHLCDIALLHSSSQNKLCK